jgi:Trypsin-like peptidase domain
MPLKHLCLTLFLLEFCCCKARAQFTQQQVDGLSKSVVRVIASTCRNTPGATFAGSGFIWKHNQSVVTALHVVNGCSKLVVQSEAAGDLTDAHVSKILLSDDLVLLTLDKSLAGSVVVISSDDPPMDTQAMLIVGFPEDSSSLTAKEVRRQFGGSTLRDIVSSQAADELSRTGSPSLATNVTFLQTILEHGHSGAPIFNHDGKLVAIADGGLKHGTTEDSWAMPAKYLADLENSPDLIASMSVQRSALLFSSELISSSGTTIACGGGHFSHLKTVRYSDVLQTADDPAGLEHLALSTGRDPTKYSFEVFQDGRTGATVVLPQNETLKADGDTCMATNLNHSVTIRARLGPVGNDPTGNQAGIDFETNVQKLTVGAWIYDPNFSYPNSLPVLGGGFSRRKDWVHFVAPFQFDGQQFETLALRNNTLLGVAALNTRWTPQIVATQLACRNDPNVSPVCPEALKDLDDWIQGTFSVHLSTLAGR